MDIETYAIIATVVSILAWPVFVVVMALLVRRAIREWQEGGDDGPSTG